MTLTPVKISVGRSIQIVRPAIVLPRIDDDGDHGTERKLLARVGPIKTDRRLVVKELIWQPGAKHWKGNTAGYVYKPGHLVVHTSGRIMGSNQWYDNKEPSVTRLDALLKLPRVRDWIRWCLCDPHDYSELLDKLDARSTVLFHLGGRS